MSDYHNKRAAEIIKRILYVTIATVSKDGEPWNSPVYSAYDEDLNFYWFSDKNSHHSQNVRKNGKAFIVIYDSTVPEGTGEGVYMRVDVKELTEKDEVLAGLRVADERVGKSKERDFANYSGNAVLRGYRATPSKMWMNDDDKDENGNYVRDIRAEVPIDVIKANLNLGN